MQQPDREVKVTTAIELDKEEKTNLANRLGRILLIDAASVKYEIDPGIIAGVIIKTDDRIIDGSVQSKLENLKQRMTAGFSANGKG